MEAIKGYHLLRRGAKGMVQSKYPALAPETIETVLDQLFTMCPDPSNAEILAACVHQNVDQVVEEVMNG